MIPRIYAYWMAFTAVGSYILGLFVLMKNRKNLLYRAWFYFCSSVGTWSLGYFLTMLPNIPKDIALFSSRFSHASGAIIPAFFLRYVLIWLDIKSRARFQLIVCYLSCVILGLFSLTPLIVVDLVPKLFFKYYPIGKWGYAFYVINFILWIVVAHYYMIKNYRIISGSKRNQMKYFLLGTISGYFGGATCFPLIFNIQIPPYPTILIIGYIFTTTYAIYRYRLLDITIAITRGVILTFVYLFIVGIPLLFALFGRPYLLVLLQDKWVYPPLLLYSVLALFAPYIYLQLQNRAERLLLSKSTRLQEELQSAQQKLFQAERLAAAGTMAVGLAHEIRNPLTSIKIFTDYLDDKYNSPEFREKFKKIVYSELDRINSLVEQLLDFSSPKPLKLEPCCVHSLLDETLSLIEPQLSKQNISLKKHYTQDIPLLQIDPKQLKQAILNICLNSLDAMPNRGELIITTTTHSEHFIITISDAGGGIALEDLPHIFDAFYTKKDKGTGLGLAITYKIIKQHRGEISVESTPGKGASFSISLPIDDNLR